MTILTMDELLSAPVATLGFAGLGKGNVIKDNYQLLVALPNVTSYSMQQTLHACPRKFALAKLKAANNLREEREVNVTFAFGHAVGAGVAEFDATLDLDKAIWQAFLAWKTDLLEVEIVRGKPTGKSFAEAVWALMLWQEFYWSETDLAEYEMIKAEATFAMDFEDGHYYMGHVDEVLRHKQSGRLLVKENKTTGSANVDTATYSNSDQGLSYSILVDMLGDQEYGVLYTVYSSKEREWLQFGFVKSANTKAEWIQDQLIQHSQVDEYAELNFFPKRGGACMQYNRRCSEYELCDLSMKHRFQQTFAELPKCESIDELRQIEHIDFSTTLSEVVARQTQRLSQGVPNEQSD